MKWLTSSLSRKMVAITLALVLAVVASVGVFITLQINTRLTEEVKTQLVKNSEILAGNIETEFAKQGMLVKQMAKNKDLVDYVKVVNTRAEKRTVPSFQRVNQTLQDIKSTSSNIDLVYLGLRNASDITTDIADYDSKPDYQITGRGWWIQAEQAGSLVYTPPYIDAVTGNVVISIVEPIYDNGNMIAAAAIDLSIVNISEMMKNFKVGKMDMPF